MKTGKDRDELDNISFDNDLKEDSKLFLVKKILIKSLMMIKIYISLDG